jgi:hypothetical protein
MMKAKLVIRIGRRRRRQASIAASTMPCALFLQIAGELDDQDGVLASQPISTTRPIWVKMLLSMKLGG